MHCCVRVFLALLIAVVLFLSSILSVLKTSLGEASSVLEPSSSAVSDVAKEATEIKRSTPKLKDPERSHDHVPAPEKGVESEKDTPKLKDAVPVATAPEKGVESEKDPKSKSKQYNQNRSRAVPDDVLCRGRAVTAFKFFCNQTPGYPEIWADGISLLGEKPLVQFVKQWVQRRTTLAHIPMRVWYDRRDGKAMGMLREQSDDVYLLERHLRNTTGKWILDFGGNAGYTAIVQALFAPEAHVLTMEPSPWTYLVLRANLAQAGLHSKVIALRGGMGGQSGTLKGTHFFGASAGSKLTQRSMAGYDRTSYGMFTSPIFTVPYLIDTYHVKDIALVKLDCEGCEWSATIPWTKIGFFERIPVLVGEFHNPYTKKGGEPYPKELTLDQAKQVYKALCFPARFNMHKGCKPGHNDFLRWNYKSR